MIITRLPEVFAAFSDLAFRRDAPLRLARNLEVPAIRAHEGLRLRHLRANIPIEAMNTVMKLHIRIAAR